MRKIVVLSLVIVALCFLIPVLGTSKFGSKPVVNENTVQEAQTQVTQSTYDYKKYTTIAVLHKKENTIEQIPLDNYLYGVVSAEMPADFELEALKAQAVVARTYTIYKIIHNDDKHGDASICDDSTCCQAWITKEDRLARWPEENRESNWNKIMEAVNTTQGKMITYNKEPINAFFHSNSGGETEIPLNVWGGTGYPYLQVVATAGEDAYSQYSSQVTLTKQEVFDKVKEKHSDLQIDWNSEDAIKIVEYTESERVKTLKVGNTNLSGVEARSIFGLRSANFSFHIENDQVIFEVKGYGHGVGMSQTGADSMAKSGSKYEEIIHHFYSNVEIIDM